MVSGTVCRPFSVMPQQRFHIVCRAVIGACGDIGIIDDPGRHPDLSLFDIPAMGLIRIRDHTPPAVSPEVIRGLSVFGEDECVCCGGSGPFGYVNQTAAPAASHLNGMFKSSMEQGLERFAGIDLPPVVLMHRLHDEYPLLSGRLLEQPLALHVRDNAIVLLVQMIQ